MQMMTNFKEGEKRRESNKSSKDKMWSVVLLQALSFKFEKIVVSRAAEQRINILYVSV